MKGARVTMFVRNTIHNDNRVRKEAQTLAEAGYRVTVIGLQGDGLADEEHYGDVRVLRVDGAGTTRRLLRKRFEDRHDRFLAGRLGARPKRALLDGNRFLWKVQNVAAGKLEPLTYLWDFYRAAARAVASDPADIWYAHDLNTLPTALRLRDDFGGKVVYDSHEYWLDCNNVYTPFARLVWMMLERALIGKADAVVTVSEGIAETLTERYGIERPRVILNTPVAAAQARGATPSDSPVAVYVGRITRRRGYEAVIRSLVFVEKLTLRLYGHGDEVFMDELRGLARELGVAERVQFMGSVPPAQIQSAIATADVGLVTIQGGALSYEYCLPSKLFEYAFAGLPVVSSDLPELRKFVDEFRLGVCVDPEKAESIADGLQKVLGNPSAYRNEQSRAELRGRFDWRVHGKELVNLLEGLGYPAPGAEAA